MMFNLSVCKPPLPTKELSVHCYINIIIGDFISDIEQSRLPGLLTDDPDELAETYNEVLSELLYKH